ncbi:MAG: type II secretion system F family protein [Clostridiaceae bacterium]|nr:type II secretion system F family protein [Clostridiaceae bacterium]
MLLIFILEIAIIGLLCYCSKGKYSDFAGTEHNKNYISRVVMSVALYIADKFILGRFSAYERKLNTKLTELYGGRDIKHTLKLHIAHKIIHMVIALLSVTFLGILMDRPDGSYAAFALIVLVIVFYASDKELDEMIKKRNFSIRYDFPDFLNKLVLLVNAGMTVQRAWEKIVMDRKSSTPLYEELRTTCIEIKNGKPEMEAYEDFARRCRVKEITKFITAIIQNLRKGNSDLIPLLKLQSNECWQLRKNMAKRMGEEASTKLVLPLMIMFVGILIIVILPAVMQLRYL